MSDCALELAPSAVAPEGLPSGHPRLQYVAQWVERATEEFNPFILPRDDGLDTAEHEDLLSEDVEVGRSVSQVSGGSSASPWHQEPFAVHLTAPALRGGPAVRLLIGPVYTTANVVTEAEEPLFPLSRSRNDLCAHRSPTEASTHSSGGHPQMQGEPVGTVKCQIPGDMAQRRPSLVLPPLLSSEDTPGPRLSRASRCILESASFANAGKHHCVPRRTLIATRSAHELLETVRLETCPSSLAPASPGQASQPSTSALPKGLAPDELTASSAAAVPPPPPPCQPVIRQSQSHQPLRACSRSVIRKTMFSEAGTVSLGGALAGFRDRRSQSLGALHTLLPPRVARINSMTPSAASASPDIPQSATVEANPQTQTANAPSPAKNPAPQRRATLTKFFSEGCLLEVGAAGMGPAGLGPFSGDGRYRALSVHRVERPAQAIRAMALEARGRE